MTDKLAGKPAPKRILANIPKVISQFYTEVPNPEKPEQRVAFGTSGHRGTSLKTTFTQTHIQAIVQAICDVRKDFGATGPLFLGMDTHALSYPAHAAAIQVLAANRIKTFIATAPGFTPTPVVSRSIIRYNEQRPAELADGIIITPSHNPPEDGGIKYNATNGGPSSEEMTKRIANLANLYIEDANRQVKAMPLADAMKSACIQTYDYATAYIEDLKDIIDFQPIREKGLKLGADALSGAGLAYWKQIATTYGINITVMNDTPDYTFSFMCIDHDGRIRMDCSSPYAMASLVAMKDAFDLGFANDPDFDRHGIVCPGYGLMNPNHYLAVAIDYLFKNRKQWSPTMGIGKTLVSSMMIDKVAQSLGRNLLEVPVGFKWFVPGLSDGSIGFGGEESAGASFLKKDGSLWTTDKDGMILALLAAEITAVTGQSPAAIYQGMEGKFGKAFYTRVDTKATAEQKQKVKRLTPSEIPFKDLAGDPLKAAITNAPGNNAPIGGIKLIGENSWTAVRPSGTEEICKVYAESFISQEHLNQVIEQASLLLK